MIAVFIAGKPYWMAEEKAVSDLIVAYSLHNSLSSFASIEIVIAVHG
jgi:hypothetical protein